VFVTSHSHPSLMFEGKDRNPPHIVTPLKQVPAGLANIRLGWMFKAVENPLAYITVAL
jgi:hypothetical protein